MSSIHLEGSQTHQPLERTHNFVCYVMTCILKVNQHSIVVIWVKIFKTEKTIEIHLVRLTEVCGKVLSKKMPPSLLKQHCYCPMSLMLTTKTAVSLQTKAIFHHLYGF